MRKHHLVSFQWNGKDHYCIWFNNRTSGFIVEDRRLKWFATRQELEQYAGQRDMMLGDDEQELALRPLNKAQEVSDSAGCNHYICIWNMAEDVARSLKLPFYGKNKATDDIYDKLFWGCNLPAMTPEGEEYIPEWSQEELGLLAKVIDEGISIIVKSL